MLHVCPTSGVKDAPFRRHLLAGNTCHPLTPRQAPPNGMDKFEDDQLQLTLRMVGYPTDSDCAFVTGKAALDFLNQQARVMPKEGVPALRGRYSGIQTKALLDVLEDMLQLNPGFRPSARELLKRASSMNDEATEKKAKALYRQYCRRASATSVSPAGASKRQRNESVSDLRSSYAPRGRKPPSLAAAASADPAFGSRVSTAK